MIHLRVVGMIFIGGGTALIIALCLSLGATAINAALVGLTYVVTMAMVASRWIRRHRSL